MLRVQANGKRRDIGLGALSDATLEEAREKARALRKAARAGHDPIAERDKSKATIPTFKVAAEACHKAREAGWTTRHADAFLSILKLHAFPKIGSLRVDSVDEKDIVAVLSPLWRDKPAAARKLRQFMGTVLDFAKGSRWRSTRKALGTESRDFVGYSILQLSNLFAIGGKEDVTVEMNAAVAMLEGIAPRNELEAMLAAQMVVTHHLSMEMTRRTMKADMMPQFEANGSMATKFSRTFVAQVEALSKLRRGGEQVVKHIHLDNRGGQAVIAETVRTGGSGNG
jgi:hypothetical protein